MANAMLPDRPLAYRACVLLGAAVAAILMIILARAFPRSGLELRAGDLAARLAPQAARADVVIVAADDASVQQYGAVKSWPRSLLATGLRHIEDGKPKVVIFDLALDQRTRSGDASLWRVMANSRNVVLGMAYDANRFQNIRPTPDDIRALIFLEQFAIADNLVLGLQTQMFPYYDFEPPVSDFTGSSQGVGVFLRETDNDGVLRNARLFYKSAVQYPQGTAPLRGKQPVPRLNDGAPVALPNLALVAAQRVFNVDKQFVHVVSGDTVALSGDLHPPVRVPVDTQGRMRIRYAGPTGSYTTYSFRDLAIGKVKPDVFRDKIVLIGATAARDDATQAEATPFPGLMPRVEVTANALSTLLNRSYVEVIAINKYRLTGALIIVALISGLCLMLVFGVRTLLMCLLLLVVYLIACYLLFVFGHLLLPILPGLGIILLTTLFALLLSLGPFRPRPMPVA